MWTYHIDWPPLFLCLKIGRKEKIHEEIHAHACDSWQAAEDGNRQEALRHFNMALEAYEKFKPALAALKEVVKATGDDKETEIVLKFGS